MERKSKVPGGMSGITAEWRIMDTYTPFHSSKEQRGMSSMKRISIVRSGRNSPGKYAAAIIAQAHPIKLRHKIWAQCHFR